MNLLPLILDSVPPSGGGEITGTLALPLATGSVLDYVVLSLSRLNHGSIFVVTDEPARNACGRHAWPETLSRVHMMPFAEMGPILAACEASDYLLILEPRYWPVHGYELVNLVEMAAAYRGATHFIPVGEESSGPKERVECDADGRIRRVQRLYDAVTWSGHTVDAPFCSIVPARAASDLDFRGLAQLRRHLLARGVFSRDLPHRTNVWDLTRPGDILSLNEQAICKSLIYPKDPGFSVYSPGVLVAETCTIGPSVRFVPPVIVHPDARIEDEATLIGPVVVGRGAVVGERAIVARSVLAPEASVAAGARVRQQVVVRQQGGAAGSSATAPRLPSLQSCCAPGIEPSPPTWEPPTRSRKRRLSLTIKRLLDILLSSLGLLLLSPLLLVVAAIIKLTSPGPVWFIHRRECQHGREFGCLKFRTMVANAHAMQRQLCEKSEVDGPQFKIDNDPRVTRIGHWLRRTNIDELPQLFNVLVGHMSLVGPRPSPFRENQICVPWRLARLSVRPGITGLWQICRDNRGDGDFHQWIYYDILYVRHRSVLLDLKILVQTILTRGGRKPVPLSSLIPAVTEPEPWSPGSVAQP
jgi:lipopolysaccharide/colanic/teichoic acid biosynthesis glycosyltransferase